MLPARRPRVRGRGNAVDHGADDRDPDPRRRGPEAWRGDEEDADAEPGERAALPDEAQQPPRPGGLDPRLGEDMRLAEHAVNDRRDDAESARRPHREVTHRWSPAGPPLQDGRGGRRSILSSCAYFLFGFTN